MLDSCICGGSEIWAVFSQISENSSIFKIFRKSCFFENFGNFSEIFVKVHKVDFRLILTAISQNFWATGKFSFSIQAWSKFRKFDLFEFGKFDFFRSSESGQFIFSDSSSFFGEIHDFSWYYFSENPNSF